MKHSISIAALFAVLALTACQKKETVVAPAGTGVTDSSSTTTPAGTTTSTTTTTTGATGMTGATGTSVTPGSTVIVTPPAEPKK